MVILSQRNHLWADVKLGSSNLTIGADGCAATCLAMINNAFGANCTPAQVAEHLDWFTPSGLILWNKLELKNAVFDFREYTFNLPHIKEVLLNPEKMIMVCVQLPRNQTHWMLVDFENTSDLDSFVCSDPWSGLQRNSDYYGPIIGAAYFSKRVPALN